MAEPHAFELRWPSSGGTLEDLNKDFFAFLGGIVEDVLFVSLSYTAGDVIYDVVIGDEKHGHAAHFRISGPGAARLAAEHHQPS